MNRLVILVILVAVAIAMFAASAEGIIALMDYYFFLNCKYLIAIGKVTLYSGKNFSTLIG